MTTTEPEAIAGWQVHPAATILPLMDEASYRALVEDIRARGLQRSITVLQGQVLDGRNRLRACLETDTQVEFETLDDDTDAIAWVLSENVHRRHLDLSPSQRALIGARTLDVEKLLARERMAQGGRGGAEERVGTGSHPSEGRARDLAGARVGVSGKSVEMAATVLASGCQALVEHVQAGRLAVKVAARWASAYPGDPARLADAVARTEFDAKPKRARGTKSAPAPSLEVPLEEGPAPPREPVAAREPEPDPDEPLEVTFGGEERQGSLEAIAIDEPVSADVTAAADKLKRHTNAVWGLLCSPRWGTTLDSDESLQRNARALIDAGGIATGFRIQAGGVARLLAAVADVLRQQENARGGAR